MTALLLLPVLFKFSINLYQLNRPILNLKQYFRFISKSLWYSCNKQIFRYTLLQAEMAHATELFFLIPNIFSWHICYYFIRTDGALFFFLLSCVFFFAFILWNINTKDRDNKFCVGNSRFKRYETRSYEFVFFNLNYNLNIVKHGYEFLHARNPSSFHCVVKEFHNPEGPYIFGYLFSCLSKGTLNSSSFSYLL